MTKPLTRPRKPTGGAQIPGPGKRLGRPPVGERVTVRLPADLIASLDAHRGAATRSEAIRALVIRGLRGRR